MPISQVLNNAAVCLIKLKHATKAIDCCKAVLQWLDPEDRKAAYRLVLASQPDEAAVPEVSDETISKGLALAAEAPLSGSCHDVVQLLLRACKDVWVAARPAETLAMQQQAKQEPPRSALKTPATPTSTTVDPVVESAAALLLPAYPAAGQAAALPPSRYDTPPLL